MSNRVSKSHRAQSKNKNPKIRSSLEMNSEIAGRSLSRCLIQRRQKRSKIQRNVSAQRSVSIQISTKLLWLGSLTMINYQIVQSKRLLPCSLTMIGVRSILMSSSLHTTNKLYYISAASASVIKIW